MGRVWINSFLCFLFILWKVWKILGIFCSINRKLLIGIVVCVGYSSGFQVLLIVIVLLVE